VLACDSLIVHRIRVVAAPRSSVQLPALDGHA